MALPFTVVTGKIAMKKLLQNSQMNVTHVTPRPFACVADEGAIEPTPEPLYN